MRAASACLAITLLSGCSPAPPNINTIEIRRSGAWTGYDITVHSNGTGEFDALAKKGKRTFTLTPVQFQQLAAAIQPYMSLARPVTDASIKDILYGRWPKCPPNDSHTTDVGGLYLRWQGPKKNLHYFVDFECDYDKNLSRYRRLIDAVRQLPVRQFLGQSA